MEAFLVQLVKTLGYTGSLSIILIALVLILLPGFSIGEEIKFNGLLSMFRKPAADPLEDADEIKEDYRYRLKISEDHHIGFDIPIPMIVIHGDMWNKNHLPVYRMLESKWRPDITSVDLTQCNITSSLVSLLHDKAQNLPSLTIYVKSSDKKLLEYFSQFQNVKIEER